MFDGRFRDRLIDGDGHLLMALRYVARNPVEVDACAQPADWPWGSYGQLVGAARGWSFVAVDECLAWFAADPTVARARVRDFVEGN